MVWRARQWLLNLELVELIVMPHSTYKKHEAKLKLYHLALETAQMYINSQSKYI